ncbi:MAG: ATP-dependent Clp protease ATP-binding subunit, partial [Paludibacteraceae bacterium]|nr:ATP-dependent Clp protease ATP-binding subunit [Paludibacteraceae bacterium]
MDFLNLNSELQTAIRIAKSLAREYGNAKYTPAHLLKAMLHKEVGLGAFITSIGKDTSYVEEWAEIRMEECEKLSGVGEVEPDSRIPKVFEEADNVRLKLGLLEITPICTLAALARPEIGFSVDQLKSFPIRENDVLGCFMDGTGAQKANTAKMESLTKEAANIAAGKSTANLRKYCVNKTDEAREGKLHAIVCRDSEIRQMEEIIGRCGKPNVMITGDSGVGKTALAEGLAFDIVNGNVPSFLENTEVWQLDS